MIVVHISALSFVCCCIISLNVSQSILWILSPAILLLWCCADITSLVQIQIFPYSVFYIFFEQYLDIWRLAVINIAIALGRYSETLQEQFGVFKARFIYLFVSSLFLTQTTHPPTCMQSFFMFFCPDYYKSYAGFFQCTATCLFIFHSCITSKF